MNSEPPRTATDSTERRGSGRRKLQEPLEIEWGSEKLIGTVRDIGPLGLFVELVPPLWIGANFLGRLCVHPPLLLNCIVCRVEPGRGNAVTFDLLEEGGEGQLQKLLAALPDV